MVDKNDEVSVQERVKSMVTRHFYISKCPEEVYVRFSEFCKVETMDNYALGLKTLLDIAETNAKELTLYKKYLEMEDRLVELEGKEIEPKEEKLKTMGSANISKGDEKNG